MAGLTGSKMERGNITNKIEDNLKVELDEEFKVFWLQGSNFDTQYEAYVSPLSNTEIRFTVYADKHGKLKNFKKSSYYTAKVWNDFSQEIVKEFEVNGIEAFCKAEAGPPSSEKRKDISKVTSLHTTVKEYTELIPNCEFGIAVFLNESDAINKETLTKIIKVLEKENEIYPGININAMFYFYEEEEYIKTKDFFESIVSPSSTVLVQNNLMYSLRNGLSHNRVNYSVEEMLKKLKENSVAQ